MKVLNFKSNSVQEKNSISTDIKNVTNADKKSNQNYISDDIQIKNFKNIASKMQVDETLDLDVIERLRAELKNKSFTTEELANSMIKNLKESVWHKRV